jgi:putative oxidoreductase
MNQKSDWGKLMLRLSTGGILLLHGIFKVFTDIQHVKNMVSAAGLPEVVAYGSILGEFVAPILVIVGWRTRIAAGVMAFNMLMTVLVAHRDIMFKLNDFGGWMIETNMLLFFSSVTIALLGAGKFSLSSATRWD